MRALALIVMLAATACTSKTAEAERRYELVEKSGTKAEKCDEARKVEDAYLSAGDEEKYNTWRKTRERDCLYSEIEGRLR